MFSPMTRSVGVDMDPFGYQARSSRMGVLR